MRVATHRKKAEIEVTFKLTGAPIVFNNPALANKLNGIVYGAVPATFSVMISKDHFPGEGPPYNPKELDHVTELEVRKFMQNFLSPDTLHANGLTLTILTTKLITGNN